MKLGTETGSARDFSVIGLYMMLLRRLVARELWNLSPSPVSQGVLEKVFSKIHLQKYADKVIINVNKYVSGAVMDQNRPLQEGVMKGLRPTATERRRKTRKDIYMYIYDSASVTKQDIAYDLKLSLPTVYQNLSELEDAGLIRAADVQKATGGRPPVSYEVTSDYRFSIGVSFSASRICMIAMDMKRNEIASAERPIDSLEEDRLIEESEQMLERMIGENHFDKNRLLGIGVTVPGVLDDNGTVILSPTMKLRHFSLKKLQEKYDCPVILENDSTCGGTAELSALPVDQRNKSFAYLFLEYGVGGAFFHNGKQWYGDHHRSAEFGHMCIVPGGRRCNCGKRGCLEAYVGSFRFSREMGISVEEFFEEVQNGNESYLEIWEDALEHLAIGISNIHRVFDCDVIIGGFLIEYLKPYMSKLEEKIARLDIFDEGTSYVKLGKYLHKAGMYGTAWNFIEKYISNI